MINDLYTRVRSLATAPQTFGFLGAHGARLEPGETYSQRGDLNTVLAASRWKTRLHKGFERALEDGVLVIEKGTALHLYDATNDETKVLNVAGGALGVIDPEWGAYSSSLQGF